MPAGAQQAERSVTVKNRIAQRMQARRQRLGFDRALAEASPSMRQELLAIAARNDVGRNNVIN
jgi:hypothetical protein